jgi:hypothetical protein
VKRKRGERAVYILPEIPKMNSYELGLRVRVESQRCILKLLEVE